MIPPLHVVTDDRILERPDFDRTAHEVLRAGGEALALHVRGPGLPGRPIYERARSLRPAARAAGATLLVNDRVDVALVLGLDGVHLGERSLPPAAARSVLDSPALVGRSVHEPAGADAGGADFLVVGTIFRSASHPGRDPAGPERIRAWSAAGAPTVAIGGVTPERVPTVLAAGARGVAVLSGIWDAEDPVGAVRAYLRALRGGSA